MAAVSFSNVEKSFGATKVIHGIGFDIADGEFMVLVGPSGCGKSTLLRMLAGLEEITSGTIAIDGKEVNDVESKDRDIAMVFQSYALYPHMTVADNMAFSLKLRKAERRMIEERVQRASKILNLDPFLKRYPRELSGGQRQRVAMGRAIVRDPKVFLFDEPLSNLDAKLRVAMRAEIKALHQRLKTTTVYVTHDQVEAMTMADRIVVMHDGRIEQIGWPLDGGPGEDGRQVSYGVRPEHLTLAAAGSGVPGEVIVVEPTGAETELVIQVGASQLILRMHGRARVEHDEKVGLSVDPANVHVFDQATGQRLAA